MKKIIILALAAMMMVGCGDSTPVQIKSAGLTIEGGPISFVVIDSCEYVYTCYRLAHKGNCRFCKERRKQELKELVEQLKEK